MSYLRDKFKAARDKAATENKLLETQASKTKYTENKQKTIWSELLPAILDAIKAVFKYSIKIAIFTTILYIFNGILIKYASEVPMLLWYEIYIGMLTLDIILDTISAHFKD